jgi:putative transposase
MPFGLYLGFEPPSVLTVLQCLHHGMLPKTHLRDMIDNKVWNIKHYWPVCGRPRTLLLDRAMENIGSDIAEVAGELGIHLRFAPRKSPWYKGAIERFLKTLNETLLHEQHGTAFGNILERGDYDPAKNAVITIGELRMQVHRWMLDVYACGKHEGMRDVPLRKWEELSKLYPIDPVESASELNVLLGRTEVRKLRRTGISFEYIEYINDELISFLSNPSFRRVSPDCLIRFKYNPDNLEYIHVYLPHNQEYLRVESAPRWRGYTRGLSIWQHRIIVKFENQRMNGAVDRDGIVKAKVEISDYFNAIWHQRRGSRGRSQAGRFLGHGRPNPVGGDDTNSPQAFSGTMMTTEQSRHSVVRQHNKVHPDLSVNKLQGRTKPLTQEVSLPNGVERNDEVDIYAKLKPPEKS